ncbi:MAG: GNAT family N-acetyltransferase [Romboutsia sp.]
MRDSIYPQMKIIETKDFILRPIRLSDARDLFEYYKQDIVVKYLPFHAHKSISETKKFINTFFIKNYRGGKVGHLAIVSKKDKKVIGNIGPNNLEIGTKQGELGICINPEYWGGDISKITTVCILSYVFDYLNMDKAIAVTYEDNKYTPKLLSNTGFKYIQSINKKISKGITHNNVVSHVYEISRDEYRINKSKGMYSKILAQIKLYK